MIHPEDQAQVSREILRFGRRNLDHITTESVEYDIARRSHMVYEYLLPVRELPDEVIPIDRDQFVVRSHVGGS